MVIKYIILYFLNSYNINFKINPKIKIIHCDIIIIYQMVDCYEQDYTLESRYYLIIFDMDLYRNCFSQHND